MQAVKVKFGGGMWTVAIVIALSLATAALYTLAVATGYWQTVATILATAGAFYAFIVQRFESTGPTAGVLDPAQVEG